MGRYKDRNAKRHESTEEREARTMDRTITDRELTPPAFLDAEARKEFTRVVDAYKEIGTIDALDLTVLAVYAEAWSEYTKLAGIIAKYGSVITKRRVTGKVDIQPNPALAAQTEMVKRIMQCSLKLGMATTDRMRLVIPNATEEWSEFDEYEG